MIKVLHIVSFDVPYPPNYGGVVDVYFKVKALHTLGVQVHLHCFEYGRGKRKELNEICESVHYYRRDESKLNFLKKDPYVVLSRENKSLLDKISGDNYPVIIEGLHNCWLIEPLKKDGRKVFVRTHNIEHDYYVGLAKVEKNIAKKQYYKWEAQKLASYEKVLGKADILFAISPNDHFYFQSNYNNAALLPAFHSGETITSKLGTGKYALYHGNLSVNENIEASLFLAERVFSKLPNHHLIIAGSNPPKELIAASNKYRNVEVRANLNVEKLESLISNAHINVLPTFQPTGIKLKLLSAFYKGRFIIANTEMVDNTGLESLCTICNQPQEWVQEIPALFKKSFTDENVKDRKSVLDIHFSNINNARKLTGILWPELAQKNI